MRLGVIHGDRYRIKWIPKEKDKGIVLQWFSKGKNNDFIIIPSTKINAKTNKNVATIWIYRSNIRIRIMPEAPKSFSSISSINGIIERIYQKYLEIR